MISGRHSTEIDVSVDQTWEYLAEFDNWAPFVVGFMKLRRVDAETTVWTLKGDVGVLSREVDLEVKILEWTAPHRAVFSITGVVEQLTGTGSFEVTAPAAEGSLEDTEAVKTPVEPKPSLRKRFERWFALRLLGRARKASGGGVRSAARTDSPDEPRVRPSDPAERCMLTFALEVTPGGPMAPMVEMLMRPLLEPAAEDLSTQIRQGIEGVNRD